HQEAVGIYRDAPYVHFVMQMRRGYAARTAYPPDDLALADFLSGDHVELGKVRIVALHPTVMGNHNQPPKSAGLVLRVRDHAISRSLNRRTGRRRYVHTLVISAFRRERIVAMPERTHQPPIDGPDARLRVALQPQ